MFDSVKTTLTSVHILNEMIKEAKFNERNMLEATKKGHLTATDLADYLVREKDVPFRTAHFITGKAVAFAGNLGVDLSELNGEQLKKVDENLDENAVKFLNLHASKETRTSLGGTANASVAKQIDEIAKWLKDLR